MTASQPVRIIYIAGYGHSGTTILDIALGQHTAVVGAGEITELTRHVWQGNEYCACGAPIQACAFWNPALKKWFEGSEDTFLPEYFKLQQKFEGLFGLAKIICGIGHGKDLDLYLLHTARLFETIRAYSNKQIIVDSSKLPGRAMALAFASGIDLRVIHVVRDGRGVRMVSLKKI